MYKLNLKSVVTKCKGAPSSGVMFSGELISDDGAAPLPCSAVFVFAPFSRLSYCFADVAGKAVGVPLSRIADFTLPEAAGLSYNEETGRYTLIA